MSEQHHSTYIETHPDYLKALGSVSAEMAALELYLSHLFTMIIFIPPSMGERIFFAPASTGARIKMFEMAAISIPDSFSNYRIPALKIAEKARKYQIKRNDFYTASG
jgi:hypothetical protein